MNCSFATNPVCGSDNQTYWSECHLRTEACRTERTITVAHAGRCDISRDRSCRVVNGRVKCVCHLNCTGKPVSSVCGSDGKIHRNDCERQLAECESGQPIQPVQMSVCISASQPVTTPTAIPGNFVLFALCMEPGSVLASHQSKCSSMSFHSEYRNVVYKSRGLCALFQLLVRLLFRRGFCLRVAYVQYSEPAKPMKAVWHNVVRYSWSETSLCECHKLFQNKQTF